MPASRRTTSPKARTTGGRRRTRDAAADAPLDERLLATALRLLAEHGPQSFSMRQLAAEVGVSHAAPYRHFATREDLFARIAADGMHMLRAAFEAVERRHALDPEAQYFAAGAAYDDFVRSHPIHAQLLFGGFVPLDYFQEGRPLGEPSRAAFGAFLRIVRNGQLSGLLGKEPTEQLGLVLWATIHGLSSLRLGGALAAVGLQVTDATHRLVAETLLRGVQGAPSRTS